MKFFRTLSQAMRGQSDLPVEALRSTNEKELQEHLDAGAHLKSDYRVMMPSGDGKVARFKGTLADAAVMDLIYKMKEHPHDHAAIARQTRMMESVLEKGGQLSDTSARYLALNLNRLDVRRPEFENLLTRMDQAGANWTTPDPRRPETNVMQTLMGRTPGLAQHLRGAAPYLAAAQQERMQNIHT